jgi:hypothetical protein
MLLLQKKMFVCGGLWRIGVRGPQRTFRRSNGVTSAHSWLWGRSAWVTLSLFRDVRVEPKGLACVCLLRMGTYERSLRLLAVNRRPRDRSSFKVLIEPVDLNL